MAGYGDPGFLVVFRAGLGGGFLRSIGGHGWNAITIGVKAANAIAVAALLGACTRGPVSALDPHGQAAAEIAWITWVMMIGGLLVVAIMSLLGLHAVFRRRARPLALGATQIVVWGGVAIPLTVLVLLLTYGVRTGYSMLPVGGDPLIVRVTAHQWWWQFEYRSPGGGAVFTANEFHLPAGRPVDVYIQSADVIHSFWVPTLGGKLDAVPGHTNVLRLRATAGGSVLRGQCSEFCGAQHARMAFDVQVHEAADFDAWLAGLAGLDRSGAGDRRGRQAFERHCALCHSVSTAEDRVGPNLANLPDRRWLGAGTLVNDADGLRRWIKRHQEIKPGNLMPSHAHLDDETVEAVARYLEAR